MISGGCHISARHWLDPCPCCPNQMFSDPLPPRMAGTGVQVLMQLESARVEDSGGAARELVIGSHAVMHEKQKLTTGRRAGELTKGVSWLSSPANASGKQHETTRLGLPTGTRCHSRQHTESTLNRVPCPKRRQVAPTQGPKNKSTAAGTLHACTETEQLALAPKPRNFSALPGFGLGPTDPLSLCLSALLSLSHARGTEGRHPSSPVPGCGTRRAFTLSALSKHGQFTFLHSVRRSLSHNIYPLGWLPGPAS